MSPQRVQRTRKAGEPGMPPGAVYVGRGSKWGNPYRVGPAVTARQAVVGYAAAVRGGLDNVPSVAVIRAELAGKDLACWCPLDAECHASVLLEIANEGKSDDAC